MMRSITQKFRWTLHPLDQKMCMRSMTSFIRWMLLKSAGFLIAGLWQYILASRGFNVGFLVDAQVGFFSRKFQFHIHALGEYETHV